MPRDQGLYSNLKIKLNNHVTERILNNLYFPAKGIIYLHELRKWDGCYGHVGWYLRNIQQGQYI
jgi:hypothetical protein